MIQEVRQEVPPISQNSNDTVASLGDREDNLPVLNSIATDGTLGL